MGNRLRNINKAKKLLKHSCKIIIKNCSSIYETESVGYKNQNKFLNAVWEIKTKLKPADLLKTLKSVEKQLGRKKTVKWGPRTIDLDILFYGKKDFKSRNLTIPHKEICNRKFVLEPLNELVPNFIHPTNRKTVKQLLMQNNKRLKL